MFAFLKFLTTCCQDPACLSFFIGDKIALEEGWGGGGLFSWNNVFVVCYRDNYFKANVVFTCGFVFTFAKTCDGRL